MIIVIIYSFIRIRKGKEPKTPRYASAAVLCDDHLPYSQ